MLEGQQPVGGEKTTLQGQAGKKTRNEHQNDIQNSSDPEGTKGGFNGRKRVGVPQIRGTFLGGPIKRTRICWCLSGGSLIEGKYRVCSRQAAKRITVALECHLLELLEP